MFKRSLLGILVGIAVTSISRGVVLAFGLDKWIAGIIQLAENSPVTEGIVWILSGVIGLLAVGIWVALRCEERLSSMLWPRPELGSFVFREFASNISVHRGSVPLTADVEMILNLTNNSPKLVRHEAALKGAANGVAFATEAGETALKFQGYAHPSAPLSLILRLRNVPISPTSGWCSITGFFDYDVAYFFPHTYGHPAKRRTRKKVEFRASFPANGAPGQRLENTDHVLFLEEEEE